jgi:hypothetical protein
VRVQSASLVALRGVQAAVIDESPAALEAPVRRRLPVVDRERVGV